MPDPRNVELAKHLSFFVPPEHVLTTQETIDRIHNECEALRIERDAARAALARLTGQEDTL
jgi:hypothetical protein